MKTPGMMRIEAFQNVKALMHIKVLKHNQRH